MATTIILPTRFSMNALYPFTRQIVGANGLPLDDHFIFDFGRVDWVDGYGLTILSNALEWLRNNGAKRQFVNWTIDRRGIRYLDDCGFFERYLKRRLNPNGQVRRTTLPCTPVAHADAHGWLEHRFTPWAAPTLGATHGALASVRGNVKEIFNNILDHSTQRIGYVHVQHYPNVDTLNITVSDFGRGIPSNIRERFGPMPDEDAILHASKRGVTTKGNPNNYGFGLDDLIDNVTRNGGIVRIYSYSGALECTRTANGEVLREPSAGNGVYPGTLVDIRLRTDLFVGDQEEREDVEW
jgi:anti-sigma regulatory factor (Ser/Thr protein kinase)